jgi:RNA polymerase sigma-70 factor (ECF subfamily)
MDIVSTGSSKPAPDMGAFFDENFTYVWNTLRRFGVRDADLEDLVQEVFLKVHVRSADYDASRAIRPWLFGFAYRVASDYRRLARHRIVAPREPAEVVDPARPADERIEAEEERALVETALAAVEIDRRAVFVLHDIHEVPVPEVAETLGIPLNTAYSRLRIAREEFATAVKRLRKARGVP